MNQHEKLNYVEFPCTDLAASKSFFEQVFNWTFTDYGEDYTAFDFQGLMGGFVRSDKSQTTANGSALLIFFSDQLESTQTKIESAGGIIVLPTITFPGGRRFQFTDPSGNEFGVWSDVDEQGNKIP